MTGHLDWKVRKISIFQSFFLLCEIRMRLKMRIASVYSTKENPIEIPVEL